MIEMAQLNSNNKYLAGLLLQIAVDPELNDVVEIKDFSPEQYSVRDLRWIKQCMSFHLK
jgi:hypothetical protein